MPSRVPSRTGREVVQPAAHLCEKLRMAAPRTEDFLSFRRTFTLLILLVVLPSAGLSGFGVVAIVNERAAVEKRLEAAWAGRLAQVKAELLGIFEGVTVTATQPLTLKYGDRVLTGVSFTSREGEVSSEDPRLATAVKALGAELATIPDRPLIFSITSLQGTYLLAAVRTADGISGAQLTPGAIEALVREVGERATPGGEEAAFALLPVKRDVPLEGVFARLMSGVTEVREAALGPPELSSTLLPAPLQDFKLVVLATGEDPVAAASTRNRVVYSVLLGLFYVTLALGVIYTARTLYREAQLSRLKTDFVSLVSHELRTPLTSIRMFIEMLALGRVKDPAEMQNVLDMLSKETARLSGLIESVLDWSRIESGTRRYEKVRLVPQELVDTSVAAFNAQRIGQDTKLAVEVEPHLPSIEVDRDALAGALLNLLQNAWKYSKPGDHRVELNAALDGDFVVLAVKDYGAGIPKAEQKRIFDRFYRIDSLLSRDTEGSGLGLSIAQRIVQAHDGWISVDSAPGEGSTFRIHLPVAV